MAIKFLGKYEVRVNYILTVIILFVIISLFFVAHTIFSRRMVNNVSSERSRLNQEIRNLKNTVTFQKKQIGQYTDMIDFLNEENISLQNTIKMLALEGKKPENYVKPTIQISRGGISRFRNMRYVGEWVGTAYTPSVEECGNDKGITSSGQAIVPGYSIAVDTVHWKYGQKFYIEGIGMVEAMDTGSAIKGKERFDLALFDKGKAMRFGKKKLKVWLVEEK